MFTYVSQSLPSLLLSASNHSVHSHSSLQGVVEWIPVVEDGVVVTGVVSCVEVVVVVTTVVLGGAVGVVVDGVVVGSVVEILVVVV